MPKLAITRDLSDTLAQCELTHLTREPINLATARRQHEAYRDVLQDLGYQVYRLPALPEFPDSVFVEDVAVVLGGTIVLTRPGAVSRRGEVALMEPVVSELAPLARIHEPGTLDGGDVLVQGNQIFVGQSSRTNAEGIEQLEGIAEPLGFTVTPVTVRGCLHLKSAATSIGPNRILANPDWVDPSLFSPHDVVPVAPGEPYGSNALLCGAYIVYPVSFPGTLDRLVGMGLAVRTVDNSELAKAEGALTCCSLLMASASLPGSG